LKVPPATAGLAQQLSFDGPQVAARPTQLGGPGSATLVVPPMLAVTPLAPPAVPVAPPSEVSFFVTPRRRFIGVRKQASPIEDNATHSASQQRPQLITGRLAESRYGRLTDYKLPSG